MSKTVDERVVSMQFDNRHFEKNVSTTMSTLDKLKQKLNFGGVSKSFDKINASAKSCNLSPLSQGIETVQAKFSALQVMGVTALANITNSAVNAGKRMVSALTIDPIKTGLSEYETKINAIQVIKSNTRGKNEMSDITAALDDLNTYADKTIYNFAQMTSNIGKFTAQGLDVYEAANAVKGMANLAAASGASAEDMARATYQMSQALAGTIKLMDWNSLRNANMATVELKNTLIDLAKVNGIAIDDMIAKHGSFEQTLSEGWLSGEMFTQAMNIYSGIYDDAELKAMGFNESQIANFKELASEAEKAATQVRTFTQLWDVLKETAQSGWTQTWELLIGDFESASENLSKLQEFLSNIINGWSEARNTFLAGALKITEPWNKIVEKLEGSGLGKIKEMAESIGDVTDKVQHFQDVVTKVWRGDFGNVDTNPVGRYTLLEEAGYDHRVVQDLVNKGYQYKITMEDIEASHKKFGLTMDKTTESTKEATQSFGELSDEQLRNAGLTEAEIRLYRDLEEEAKSSGKSISQLVDEMSKMDGRTMLIESLKNAGTGLLNVFRLLKDAWVEAFPPPSSVGLYYLIKDLYEFSQKLTLVDKETGEYTETAKKLLRIFKGLVAAIDIVATLTGGVFRVVFKAAQAILNAFGMDVLDFAAMLGDGIVAVRDWIDAHDPIVKLVEKIVPGLMKMVDGVKGWLTGVKDGKNVPAEIIAGWVGGLWDGAKKLYSTFIDIATKVIEVVCDVLGIHSPSLVFMSIGAFILLGLIAGLVHYGPKVWETIKEVGKKLISSFKDVDFKTGLQQATAPIWEFFKSFGKKLIEFIKNIDFGKILAAGIGIGLIAVIKSVSDAIGSITDLFKGLFDGVGQLLKDIGSMFKGIGKMFSGIGNMFNSIALINLAIAIGILAASLYLIAKIDKERLLASLGALAALALVIGGLLGLMTVLNSKFPKLGSGADGAAKSLVAIAAAVLIIAIAMKALGTIEAEKLSTVVDAMVDMLTGVAIIIGALVVLSKVSADISKVGGMLLKMSIALLIVVVAMKMMAGMDESAINKSMSVVSGIALLFMAIIAVSTLAGEHADKAGKMLLRMSIAMGVMVLVVKAAAKMTWDDIEKGLLFVGGVELLFAAIIYVSRLCGNNASKAGSMLFKMATAMAIMVGVVKLVSYIEDDELKRGLSVVGALELMFAGLIAVSKLAGSNASQAGTMLLKMSVAMLLLTGVIFLISEMDPKGVWSAMGVIAALGAIFAGLIAVTHLAKDCTGTIVALTVAVGILAVALIALSFIDPANLAAATGALTLVIGVFSLLIYATKSLENAKLGKVIPMLAVLVIVVGLLGKIVGDLADANPDSALGAAIGLSALLLAVTGAAFILNKFGHIGRKAVRGVGLLMAMAAPLYLFSLVLSSMSDVQNALNNAIVLGALAAAMTVLLIPLALIGTFAGLGAFAGVVLLALMAGPLIAFVEVLAEMQGIQNAQTNADLLSSLVWSMSKSLLLLTAVGLFGPAALIGVGTLLAAIVLLGDLAIEFGKYMKENPKVQEFIDIGLPVLEQLAGGLGRMIGKFIGGVADGMLSFLPSIGESLSEFMDNAQGFITGAKDVNEKVAIGAGILVAAIIGLTIADFINGITSILSLGGGLPVLGLELSLFAISLLPFITTVKMIDESTLTAAKNLTDIIIALSGANFLNGITNLISLGDPWKKFAEGIVTIGKGVADFAAATSDISEDDLDKAKTAAGIIDVLADVSTKIPNIGGLSAVIFGDNEIGAWGAQLKALGDGLISFITPLREAGLSDDDTDMAKDAADIITTLADAAKAIPNSGGLVGFVVGDNDMGSWANQMISVSQGIVSFIKPLREAEITQDDISLAESAAKIITTLAGAVSEIPNAGGILAEMIGDNKMGPWADQMDDVARGIVGFLTPVRDAGLTEDDKSLASTAAGIITTLADAAKDIPNAGGDLAKWFGDNEISTWAGKLPEVAEGITGFAGKLGDLAPEDVSKAKNFSDIIVALAGTSGDIGLFDADLLVDMTGKLPDIGTDISDFIGNMGGVDKDKASSVKTIVNSIVTAIKKVIGIDSSSVTSFTDSLKSLAESGISSFVDTFTSETVTKQASEAASSMLDSASAAISGNGNVAKFKSIGMQLAEGFAKGIQSGSYMSVQAAMAMATAAIAVAKSTLKINSPSKVFRAIGEGIPEGFVAGIDSMIGQVEKSSDSMAQSSISNVSKSISRIADLVNSDIDTQPTIRPILDLSDVESGASTIGSMFGLAPSVGLMSNVGAINSAMSYGQNGGNSDVVSAIDKLGHKIDNIQGNTTNVNGVTYDDGSNVSNAVRSLIRAAKIERRS